MENYYIALLDKESRKLSNRVPLKDIIYNQDEVEFEFESEDLEDYETLPYKDFLFWRQDYEVVIEFGKGEQSNE